MHLPQAYGVETTNAWRAPALECRLPFSHLRIATVSERNNGRTGDPLEPVPKLDGWEPVGTEIVQLAGKRDQ